MRDLQGDSKSGSSWDGGGGQEHRSLEKIRISRETTASKQEPVEEQGFRNESGMSKWVVTPLGF